MFNKKGYTEEEAAHEYIVDNLTHEQEDMLMEEHSQDYMGCDDDMCDAYGEWLCELSLDEIVKILKIEVPTNK